MLGPRHNIIGKILMLGAALITCTGPAMAQEDKQNPDYTPARFVDRVTFSYMAYHPEQDAHSRQAKWQLQNVANWQKFSGTLAELPEKDKKRNTPTWVQPEAPDSDYIRVRVITTNAFVARKIDIYRNTIRIITRQPKTVFYKPEKAYLKHLKQEQKSRKAFPDKFTHTKLTDQDNGIIVRYKRFVNMPNPVWRMDKPAEQNRLFDILDSLKTIPKFNVNYARRDTQKTKTAEIVFKNIATPGNFEKIEITPAFVRGEKIKKHTYYLKDKANYFAFFQKRARRYMQ